MPKIKTHRGAAKRFSFTGSGKVRRNQANRRHILTKKTRQRKRDLRGSTMLAKVDEGLVKQMLPNG